MKRFVIVEVKDLENYSHALTNNANTERFKPRRKWLCPDVDNNNYYLVKVSVDKILDELDSPIPVIIE